MVRLGLAFSGGRVSAVEAVERTAGLGIGATVLWVDLAEGPEALGPAVDRARALGLEVLGLNCYANLVHPTERAWNVEQASRALAFAAAHGVPWVNMMAGTRETGLSFWAYHPDNYSEATWADLLASVRALLRDGVRLTLEPYMLTPLATTERLKRLLDQIRSENLAICLDPVNLVEPREYHRSAEVVAAMCAALGDRVVAVHAKDHYLHRQKATVQIDERVPGEGELPYGVLLRAMPQDAALVIEHLREDAQIAAARDFIRRTAAETGVPLR
ncbi:MAG TPA: TIM barrel protein [Chloroflexota bacterium]|jgi:sugar phosphate isomerase/epimerase